MPKENRAIYDNVVATDESSPTGGKAVLIEVFFDKSNTKGPPGYGFFLPREIAYNLEMALRKLRKDRYSKHPEPYTVGKIDKSGGQH